MDSVIERILFSPDLFNFADIPLNLIFHMILDLSKLRSR